ncbi:MAG TPA: hypothetical protein VEV15_03990 [Flavisolibacter sp.]|nr:hypothetical protein [Flavisolibacter sp.]
MRKTALLFVIAVYGYAANAQLTLRPQTGIEIPATKISYNNLPSFKPACQSLAQFGLRADYAFKGGLGPFVGLFTHRPSVNYNFNDPEKGMTAYNATVGDLQLQVQAGLQYSTKPLLLSKKTAAVTSGPENMSASTSGCGGRKSGETQNLKQKAAWTVRLQPAAGLGYAPSNKPDLEAKNSGTQTSYTYRAGNTKTELISGLGFEFARNRTKFLSLSINYFKGLGSNEMTFTTQSSAKTVTTTLSSKVSGWNASIGIPISFAKKNTIKNQRNYHRCSEQYKRKCGSYRRI